MPPKPRIRKKRSFTWQGYRFEWQLNMKRDTWGWRIVDPDDIFFGWYEDVALAKHLIAKNIAMAMLSRVTRIENSLKHVNMELEALKKRLFDLASD